MTLPSHEGALGSKVGKGLTRGPLTFMRDAREQSVVRACMLFGVGSVLLWGCGVYQSPLRRLRSWLSLETLYKRRAVFWVSILSLRSIGRMVSSW